MYIEVDVQSKKAFEKEINNKTENTLWFSRIQFTCLFMVHIYIYIKLL